MLVGTGCFIKCRKLYDFMTIPTTLFLMMYKGFIHQFLLFIIFVIGFRCMYVCIQITIVY